MKRQVVFSFILATLSFIATKALEHFGVNEFYKFQAENFNKESGYFDLHHPNAIRYIPTGLFPFSEIATMDSTHIIAMQANGGNGLVLLSTDTNSFSVVNPLPASVKLNSFVRVDSLLYLIDDHMGVYVSSYPYDSTSSVKVTDNAPSWKSSSACFHKSTHRIYFNSDVNNPVSRSRFVFTYNVNKNRYVSVPLFAYDVDAIERFALDNGLKIHATRITETNDTLAGLTLIPNAIAVHPKTNEVYILSGIDKALVVFDQFGEIKNFTELDPSLFPNPSGLAFADNGDLLISNEDFMKNSIVRIPWNKLWQSKGGKGLIFGR